MVLECAARPGVGDEGLRVYLYLTSNVLDRRLGDVCRMAWKPSLELKVLQDQSKPQPSCSRFIADQVPFVFDEGPAGD